MLLQNREQWEQQGVPEEGYALPTFSLEDAGGRTIRLWDYKQRRPVLLAFVHATDCACCRVWLRSLLDRQAQLHELRVVTLVVVPEPAERLDALQAELGSVASMLSDAERAVTARYIPTAPTAGSVAQFTRPKTATASLRQPVGLYAADRYLHCLGRWFAEDADTLPPLDEPLSEIAFATQEGCGCSLPAWPPR
ncbi:MAG TPA: redoxin domain-containing protein [Ktedonobacterales bacterium]